MKFTFLVPVCVLLMQWGNVSAQQAISDNVSSSLKSRSDSVAYAFGMAIGQDLLRSGLTKIDREVLVRAVADLFAGQDPLLDMTQQHQLISSAISEAKEQQNVVFIEEGNEFLEKNKAKPGVLTTASGLQYEVIREGEGSNATADAVVTVHYKGSLVNGTVFDSSYERGEPATFPLTRVINGWQEGVQLMNAGAHYRFYVPYQLGYGSQGAGRDIPPYSVLIFDIELVEIQETVVDTGL